jgi:hypothetical protein
MAHGSLRPKKGHPAGVAFFGGAKRAAAYFTIDSWRCIYSSPFFILR